MLLGSIELAFGVALWLIKDAYSELKTRVKGLEDSSVRKDDFREFKQELFARLDKIEERLSKNV